MLRPFAHPVACCCVMLGVVAQSLKPVKMLSQQLPTCILFSDRRSVAQQFWIPFAQLLQHVEPTHAHVGPSIVKSHCIRLHTNTDASTPNFVGPTLCPFSSSFRVLLNQPASKSVSSLSSPLGTFRRWNVCDSALKIQHWYQCLHHYAGGRGVGSLFTTYKPLGDFFKCVFTILLQI